MNKLSIAILGLCAVSVLYINAQQKKGSNGQSLRPVETTVLTDKTGPVTYYAPCDPQHPTYIPIQAKSTIKCVSAQSEDPLNQPGRAYAVCFPSCGGPWTLAPGDTQTVTNTGTLYVMGNGKGTPNTCGASVAVSNAQLPQPPSPPGGTFIPGKIEGRTVQVKVGEDVSSTILAVAYMCQGHSFIPNNTLTYFDATGGWQFGWLGSPVGNGLSYYGSHKYSAPGSYPVYLRADARCPNGENNGYDAAKGQATVNVVP